MSIRYDSDSMTGSVTYDPAIIQKFAAKMYFQARSIVVVYTILGLVAGAIGGYSLASAARQVPFTGFGALLVGFLGYLVAQPRAFQLRLLAQTALCQMTIEQNTRKS